VVAKNGQPREQDNLALKRASQEMKGNMSREKKQRERLARKKEYRAAGGARILCTTTLSTSAPAMLTEHKSKGENMRDKNAKLNVHVLPPSDNTQHGGGLWTIPLHLLMKACGLRFMPPCAPTSNGQRHVSIASTVGQ
jgi:hypothetical protein